MAPPPIVVAYLAAAVTPRNVQAADTAPPNIAIIGITLVSPAAGPPPAPLSGTLTDEETQQILTIFGKYAPDTFGTGGVVPPVGGPS